MSNLTCKYPLDHRVFQGGRYLRAFDHAADIDHYEHSILLYLGSLMPFDKKFVDQPAWPSIATISSSTKISPTTVRKKLKSLEQKGYLKVEAVRYLNERGHFQQGSNNYCLSTQGFDFFEDVLKSSRHLTEVRKRAVGESLSWSAAEVSYTPHEGGYNVTELPPLPEPMPNSSTTTSEDILTNPHYSERDLFTRKAEVDRIIEAWEKLLNIPVSKGEKDRFFREYVRTNGNEIHYSERVLQISADPYLSSRARSINFLFSGLDCALRNKADIVSTATRALRETHSQSDLKAVLESIPAFIRTKSLNYGSTSHVVNELLKGPITEATNRLGVEFEPPLPSNARELRAEIERLLISEMAEKWKDQLRIILQTTESADFGQCLRLFKSFKYRLNSPSQHQ